MSDQPAAKLVLDHDAFEAEMEGLAVRLAERIVEDLKEAGLKGSDLADLAGSIAFSVMNIIDGGEVDEDEDDAPMVPILTFAKSGEDPEALVWCGGTSWMHEAAFGLIEDIAAVE